MSSLSSSNLSSAGKKAGGSSKVCACHCNQNRLVGRLSALAVSNSVLLRRGVAWDVDSDDLVCGFQLLALCR